MTKIKYNAENKNVTCEFIYLFILNLSNNNKKKIDLSTHFEIYQSKFPNYVKKDKKRTKQLLFQNTISYRFHSNMFSSTMRNRFKNQHEMKCEI